MKAPPRRHWVPLAIGGVAGALYAWVGTGASQPSSRTNPVVREVQPAPVLVAPRSTTIDVPPNVSAPSTSTPNASANSAVSSAPAASAAPSHAPAMPSGGPVSSAPSATPARIFAAPAITSAEELLEIQVRCNRKVPEDCERAALPLEQGSFSPPDPARARALRRMALTLYVKQCEGKRAAACARLAEMYEAGEQVQANPRNAQALRKRVRELCALGQSDDPACH